MIVDWQGRLTLDPPWVICHQSAIVSAPVQGKTRMSPIKRLRCFVVGCNNEHSSRHLLQTSEPLKIQRINVTFVLKGMRRSPICLNVFMFTANHSWSSFIYRRREYKGFDESLQIIFPNNVLVSQFRGWSLQSAHHLMEERGGVSRAH